MRATWTFSSTRIMPMQIGEHLPTSGSISAGNPNMQIQSSKGGDLAVNTAAAIDSTGGHALSQSLLAQAGPP